MAQPKRGGSTSKNEAKMWTKVFLHDDLFLRISIAKISLIHVDVNTTCETCLSVAGSFYLAASVSISSGVVRMVYLPADYFSSIK